MKINIQSIKDTLLFTTLIIADLFSRLLPSFFGYIDEVIALYLIIKMLYMLSLNCVKLKPISLFLILILVGVCGNIISMVVSNPILVIYDVFLFCKPYIYLGYLLQYRKKHVETTMYYYSVISKMMLWILLIFSMITFFFPLGMIMDRGTFRFYSSFDGTVACWTLIFFTVIWCCYGKLQLIYYIISCFIILRTGSGLGGLCIIFSFLLYIFGQKQRKFKWYYLLIIVPICLFVAKGEIESYLLDRNAPRALLYMYAFITANAYFPFGSGFASYGSPVAASNYSHLYLKYGFNNRWGMSVDYHPFLMDSYYPQIIAQFGYIGLLIYLLIFSGIFKKVVLKLADKRKKYPSLFLISSWLIAGIGFGTGSVWGCSVFWIVGLIYNTKDKCIEVKNE